MLVKIYEPMKILYRTDGLLNEACAVGTLRTVENGVYSIGYLALYEHYKI